MTIKDTPIAIILPAREGFSPNAFGAVSLTVRDFSLYSKYSKQSYTFGMRKDTPFFDKLYYEPLEVDRQWYETNTRAYLRALRNRMHSLNPSLVEVHNRPTIAKKLAKSGNYKVALFLHNDPQEMRAAKTPRLRDELLEYCDAIYCISQFIQGRFLEDTTGDDSKVHVVHGGLELGKRPESKEQHILYVGRMTPNKGVLEYVQALELCLPEHQIWQASLVGGRRHSVSEQLSDYEKKVQGVATRIGPKVEMKGFLPHSDTLQCYKDASIVVVPSTWDEPYGRTALEAMAQGCAVITSGRGGLREIVGDAGIIIDEVTPQHIAEAITKLIESPQELQRYQRRGFMRAQDFTIQRCTERFDAIREKIIAGTPEKEKKEGKKELADAA